MRQAILLLIIPAVAAGVVAACKGSSDVTDGADGGEEATVLPPSEEDDEEPPTGPAGTGAATGLPCDVQGVIENRCIACHDGVTQVALLDYDDFLAKSTKDPSKTLAEAAVLELKAKTMPPTPAVPPEEDEVLAFEEWVDGGTKKNPESCTDMPPDLDGGALDGGADASTGCTSGKTWDGGDEGSPLMHPGRACNNCHQQNGGPNLRVAGTVYPSLKEPDECIGSAPPPPLTVTVTDSRPGRPRTVTMQVNASGNFFTRTQLRPPLRAVVSDCQKTRAMQGSVTSGDCNSCHTSVGVNGAPGRILAP